MSLIPGDPATAILGSYATPENVARLNQQLGLDKPLFQRYFIWLSNLIQGDFGRSMSLNRPVIDEILERFNNKIKDPRRAKKGKNVAKIIKDFLKIKCSIDQAANKLNYFFKKNKINLRVENNYFPITKNKVSKLNIRYSASFGRQLEYYTGLVFKIEIKKKSQNINIINGGRYDNLIRDLGSNKKIPAVGAAINLND